MLTSMTAKNALIQPDRGQKATAIHLMTKSGLADFAKGLSPAQRAALAAQKFEGSAFEQAVLPDGDEWLVAAGVADTEKLSSWCLAKLAETLPAGSYRLATGEVSPNGLDRALIGWASGQYRFDRYRSEPKEEGARVLLTGQAKSIDPALAEAEALALVRDLVNTPAEDMGPAELEEAAEAIAKAHKADFRVTQGDTLEREFPMVHMVGRAAAREKAPRMIELEWGNAKHPRLALVGKGKPAGNRRVISRRAGIGLAGHADAEGQRRAAVLRHLRQQFGIVGGVGQDGDEIVVLGR